MLDARDTSEPTHAPDPLDDPVVTHEPSRYEPRVWIDGNKMTATDTATATAYVARVDRAVRRSGNGDSMRGRVA
jgi:hypothetical protein